MDALVFPLHLPQEEKRGVPGAVVDEDIGKTVAGDLPAYPFGFCKKGLDDFRFVKAGDDDIDCFHGKDLLMPLYSQYSRQSRKVACIQTIIIL